METVGKHKNSPCTRLVLSAYDRINPTLSRLSTTSTHKGSPLVGSKARSPDTPTNAHQWILLSLLYWRHTTYSVAQLINHSRTYQKFHICKCVLINKILCVWHHQRFNRTQTRTGPARSHALKKASSTCIFSFAWTITTFMRKLPNWCMEIENRTHRLC